MSITDGQCLTGACPHFMGAYLAYRAATTALLSLLQGSVPVRIVVDPDMNVEAEYSDDHTDARRLYEGVREHYGEGLRWLASLDPLALRNADTHFVEALRLAMSAPLGPPLVTEQREEDGRTFTVRTHTRERATALAAALGVSWDTAYRALFDNHGDEVAATDALRRGMRSR